MKEETRLQFFSSEDQTWATPQWLFNKLNSIFNFKLDPCAAAQTAKCDIYYTKKIDGLKQDWAKVGNAFVNPPFNREISYWCKKSYEESKKGINVIMLIPARTDTRYYHDYCFKSKAICFIKGRIKFENFNSDCPKNKWTSAFFPSAIIIFGEVNQSQLSQLSDLGKVMTRG